MLIFDLTTATSTPSAQFALDWPSHRAFPSFPEAAQSIDAADLTALTGEEQCLLSSLQGLVNRKQPRLYLYWNDDGDGNNRLWLEGIRHHLKVTDWSANPFRLLEKYRSEIKGAILYDMNVRDTTNLASTLAGLQESVVATADLAHAHTLPIVQDLRGKFKNKLEVYSYGLEKVYPKSTKRLIAAIAPRAGKTKPNAVFRDYIVATAAPCIWLDPDDADEVRLLRRILKTFETNAAYLGWFPHGHEMTGVTEVSQHKMHVVAIDFLYNSSLLGGLKRQFPIRTSSADRAAQASLNRNAPGKRIENKVYVSFTWSEGDNIQYCQRRMRFLWNDPNRGTVPMGWTITPLLVDIAPNILNYFQITATANDALVIGPSGAGYTNPVNWPPNDYKLFLDQTARYMQEAGTGNVIWVYNRINGKPIPISKDMISAYRKAMGPDLLGIAVDEQENSRIKYRAKVTGDLAITGLLQIDGVDVGLRRLKKVSESHFDGTTPLFVTCSVTAWNATVSDINRLAQRLGGEFEVVRPDVQFEMIRRQHARRG